jgi:hypothetical protein
MKRRDIILPSRGIIPGMNGDVFVPGGGYPPGIIGQSILLDHPFTHIADPRGLADADGLGSIFGVPTFLWVAGDGNSPTLGPALSVTGTPDAIVSPYQLESGSDVAGEEYDGTEYRNTATIVDPSAGDDIIVFALVKNSYLPGGTEVVISNRTGGAGWVLYSNSGNARILVSDGVGTVFRSLTWLFASFSLLIAVIDGNGNMYLLRNGIASASAVTPAAGKIGADQGLAVASYAGGAAPFGLGGQIIFAGFQYGTGIADAWIADSFALAKDFTQRFTGTKPRQGADGTFTRASAASWQDRNDVWHIASDGLPRAGDSEGLRAAPTRENKVYNTINPQVTTGWSTTGGTHTVPSDAAQLATDDLQVFGPNVHQFVPGGADQIIYGGAATGNLNKHSSSIFLRGLAGGESVDVGVRDASSGVFTNHQTVVLTTSWQRVVIKGWTPGDTDEVFGLDCDTGDTILFIQPQMEQGDIATSPIPNWQTAATATRVAEMMTTSETPSDIQGSIQVELTPLGFSQVDLPSGVNEVIGRSGGALGLLIMITNSGYRAYDTASNVQAGTVTDGVTERIRSRWGDSGLSIDVGGARASTVYSGTLRDVGTVEIAPTANVEVGIRDLRAYRNGDG